MTDERSHAASLTVETYDDAPLVVATLHVTLSPASAEPSPAVA